MPATTPSSSPTSTLPTSTANNQTASTSATPYTSMRRASATVSSLNRRSSSLAIGAANLTQERWRLECEKATALLRRGLFVGWVKESGGRLEGGRFGVCV